MNGRDFRINSHKTRVYYQIHTDPFADTKNVFSRMRRYGNILLKVSDFEPSWVVIITWTNVRYYGATNYDLVSSTSCHNNMATSYTKQFFPIALGSTKIALVITTSKYLFVLLYIPFVGIVNANYESEA